MSPKVRIEVDPAADEEILIRCRTLTSEVLRLQQMAEGALISFPKEMALTLGNTEYFVPLEEILFFESTPKGTAAHTVGRMYYTELTLSRLCDCLPPCFMRASKSSVVNLRQIESLRRDVTGIAEATFRNSSKSIYVSRMYSKPFRERLHEIRLNERNKNEMKEILK